MTKRTLTRVWGRSPRELTVEIHDPCARGLLRSVRGRLPTEAVDPHCVTIRPAIGRDHEIIDSVRRANHGWLGPWEATLPPNSTEILPDLRTFRRTIDRQQRDYESLAMEVEIDGEVAGLVTVSSVQWGAMRCGTIGYWVVEKFSRRGLGSLSVAVVIDLVLGELGMHRIEINVRPENVASLALCAKLGLRREGLKLRFINIAGQWADHVAFAIDTESNRCGLVKSIWNESVF